MRDHKELDVWKTGVNLVTAVYVVTKSFPKEELYGLTNQLRRAAVSVPSNIAEGAARQTSKEFIQFLYVALGSLAEVETQLIIAERLGYMAEASSPWQYSPTTKNAPRPYSSLPDQGDAR